MNVLWCHLYIVIYLIVAFKWLALFYRTMQCIMKLPKHIFKQSSPSNTRATLISFIEISAHTYPDYVLLPVHLRPTFRSNNLKRLLIVQPKKHSVDVSRTSWLKSHSDWLLTVKSNSMMHYTQLVYMIK